MSNDLFTVLNVPESSNYFITKKLENYFPGESNRDKYVDGEGILQNANSNNDLSDLYSKLYNDDRKTVYFNKSLEIDGSNKTYLDLNTAPPQGTYNFVYNIGYIRPPKTIFYLSIRKDYYKTLEGDATLDGLEDYIESNIDNDKYLNNNLLTFFTNTGNDTKADKYNNIFVGADNLDSPEEGNAVSGFSEGPFAFFLGKGNDQQNNFFLNDFLVISTNLREENLINITVNSNNLFKIDDLSSTVNGDIDDAFDINNDANEDQYKYDTKVYNDILSFTTTADPTLFQQGSGPE